MQNENLYSKIFDLDASLIILSEIFGGKVFKTIVLNFSLKYNMSMILFNIPTKPPQHLCW